MHFQKQLKINIEIIGKIKSTNIVITIVLMIFKGASSKYYKHRPKPLHQIPNVLLQYQVI